MLLLCAWITIPSLFTGITLEAHNYDPLSSSSRNLQTLGCFSHQQRPQKDGREIEREAAYAEPQENNRPISWMDRIPTSWCVSGSWMNRLLAFGGWRQSRKRTNDCTVLFGIYILSGWWFVAKRKTNLGKLVTTPLDIHGNNEKNGMGWSRNRNR